MLHRQRWLGCSECRYGAWRRSVSGSETTYGSVPEDLEPDDICLTLWGLPKRVKL